MRASRKRHRVTDPPARCIERQHDNLLRECQTRLDRGGQRGGRILQPLQVVPRDAHPHRLARPSRVGNLSRGSAYRRSRTHNPHALGEPKSGREVCTGRESRNMLEPNGPQAALLPDLEGLIVRPMTR